MYDRVAFHSRLSAGVVVIAFMFAAFVLFVGVKGFDHQFDRPTAQTAGSTKSVLVGTGEFTNIRATGTLLVTQDSRYGWCYHVYCPNGDFITLGILTDRDKLTISSEAGADYFGDPRNCHRREVTARAEFEEVMDADGRTIRFCRSLMLNVWDLSAR